MNIHVLKGTLKPLMGVRSSGVPVEAMQLKYLKNNQPARYTNKRAIQKVQLLYIYIQSKTSVCLVTRLILCDTNELLFSVMSMHLFIQHEAM